MLTLAFLFDDAIASIPGHQDAAHEHLNNVPLPAAVHLMQADVISLYTYAMDHYLILPLEANCLQGSSLGNPYQKWAHVNNENFEKLSFGINNLLRYTSRLVSGPWIRALPTTDTREKSKIIRDKWNLYTELICETKFRRFGFEVKPDRYLTITPLKISPSIGDLWWFPPDRYVVRFTDEKGATREDHITKEEYDLLEPQIRVRKVDITERAILGELHDEGHGEISILAEKYVAFGKACNDFYKSRDFSALYMARDDHWI